MSWVADDEVGTPSSQFAGSLQFPVFGLTQVFWAAAVEGRNRQRRTASPVTEFRESENDRARIKELPRQTGKNGTTGRQMLPLPAIKPVVAESLNLKVQPEESKAIVTGRAVW